MVSARHPSLQRRVLAWVLGAVAAVWLATAVMTWVDVRHELDELLDSHLAQAAALLVVQPAGKGIILALCTAFALYFAAWLLLRAVDIINFYVAGTKRIFVCIK